MKQTAAKAKKRDLAHEIAKGHNTQVNRNPTGKQLGKAQKHVLEADKKKSTKTSTTCICGKPTSIHVVGEYESRNFCSEQCFEVFQRSKRAPEEASIIVNSAGTEGHFQQGSIRFRVDLKNINKVLGINGESGPVDQLMDSQLAEFAKLNGIPVAPYSREMLTNIVTSPLKGFLQLVWYRDVEGHTSEHLNDNQQKRVIRYMTALKSYKAPVEAADGTVSAPKRASSVKSTMLSKSYKVVKGEHKSVASGRETDLLGVLKSLKQASSFSEIVAASKDRVKTKQNFEAIISRFLRELIAHGAVEEVAA